VLAIFISVLFLAAWIGLFLLEICFGEDVGVWYDSTTRVIPRVIKGKKRKIGKDVVWNIPTRHVKFD
jgi:hypothetical protein